MEPEVTGRVQTSLVVFATECRRDPFSMGNDQVAHQFSIAPFGSDTMNSPKVWVWH
jgi:hypothetical protein